MGVQLSLKSLPRGNCLWGQAAPNSQSSPGTWLAGSSGPYLRCTCQAFTIPAIPYYAKDNCDRHIVGGHQRSRTPQIYSRFFGMSTGM